MSAEVLFDSEHIRVVGRKGSSRYGVITFGPATQFARGAHFWGDRIAEKADLTVVGIMGHRPNWFPSADIDSARGAIRAHLQHLPQIISYGSSMGGYGSIKFARVLGATHTLAFAPQWSIDPSDLGEWDRRFVHNFDPVLHAGCRIQEQDVAGPVVLFFDPFHKQDRMNVERIESNCLNVTRVPAWLMGHFPVHAFAGTDRSVAMFEMCLNGDFEGLRRTMAMRRRDRQLGTRAQTLADYLVPKDVNAARKVFAAHRDKFAPKESAMFHHVMCGEFIRQKRFDEAAECSDIALSHLADVRDFYVRRSTIESGRKAHVEAIRFANIAVERWPGLGTRRSLAGVLLEKGDTEAALAVLEEAARDEPVSAQLCRQIAEICVGLPRWSKAVQWAEELVKLAPTERRAYDLLARANSGFGNLGKAAAARRESDRLRTIEISARATPNMADQAAEPQARPTSFLASIRRHLGKWHAGA